MKKLIRLTLVMAVIISGVAMTMPQSDRFALAKPDDLQQSPSPKPDGAQSRFLGVESCAACHADIVEKQRASSMAKAMEKADNCQILLRFPDMKFQQGKFSFRISRQGDRSVYTIADGKSEISMPILYCFGQGKAGQTYVYEYNGAMHESRVSFYADIKGLDFTLGYAHEIPQTLSEAAGRQMSLDETRRCFSCHTTGALQVSQLKLSLSHAVPGINCESCHGPGDQHVAAIRAGEKAPAKMKRLGDLDGDDITQNMCGSCHRSVEDVIALPKSGGIGNVRFQPYRIFNSRCYSADKRIGCTACHDPHGELERSPAYYDAKCLACHQSTASPSGTKLETKPVSTSESRDAKACKVGSRNCASCHMSRIDLPGAHFKFTDHRIRVVREGEPFPN